MLEPGACVGAVGLFDGPGQAYEALRDLIDARLPYERIAFLVYGERESDAREIHDHEGSVRISDAKPGPGHAGGEEVGGAGARQRAIEMVRTGDRAGTAAEYADAVLRGASLVVVDVDERYAPHVDVILDRYDRINEPSWNWAWEHGGLFGRDELDASLTDALSAPLDMRLHRTGPCVWRYAVLAGRDDSEGDEDLEEDEAIRFPSPEEEPPAEFPEDPERPPREPN